MEQRYTLKQAVRITGYSFLGHKASFWLNPTDKPGWWVEVCGQQVQLTADMLHLGYNRLNLKCGPMRICICEHLLAMKTLARVDGVCIVMETTGLPFDGSALIYWRALERQLRPDGYLEPYEPLERMESEARRLRRGVSRFVRYLPLAQESGLHLSVNINYGSRWHGRSFSFPADFESIVGTKAWGGPRARQLLARTAEKYGWPHYDNFVWGNDHTTAEMLQLHVEHRALDVAGGLALLAPPGSALVGLVESHCAGHADDYVLSKKVRDAAYRRRVRVPFFAPNLRSA